MKISDQLAAASPMVASQATAPQKDDAWRAQLERAWLDSWRGDQPERQHIANPGATELVSPTPAARSDRSAPANLHERCSHERDSMLPERSGPMPIRRPHEGALPAAALLGPMAMQMEAPASAAQGPASGPGQRAAAGFPASALRLAQPLTHGHDDAAPPAQAEAQRGAAFSHAPQPMPARSALQVAVVDGAAQVTLRDAALNAGEVARIPQALAHQLLESGLASVRLYVNGRMSQHTRSDRSQSGQLTHSDTGSTAVPLHPTPLERK